MTVPVVPDEADHPSVISNHSSHPNHKLRRVAGDGREFTCKGCKRPGSGASARYRCEHKRCDFELHACCAVAPDTLTHPAFPDHEFLFLQKPEPPRASTGGRGGGGTSCGACGKPVLGFVCHCSDEDLDIDLHPSCARQQDEHDAIRVADGRISAPIGKEAVVSRQPEPSDDKDNRGRGIHLTPFALHRWDGRQAVKRDPTPEDTQLNKCARQQREHAVVRVDDGRVCAPVGKEAVVSRRPEPSDDKGNRGRGIRLTPFARHRWDGRQVIKQDPTPEKPQRNNIAVEIRRQEVLHPGDMSGERYRRRGAAPFARHRSSKR